MGSLIGSVIVPILYGIAIAVNVAVWLKELTSGRILTFATDIFCTMFILQMIGGSVTLNASALWASLIISSWLWKKMPDLHMLKKKRKKEKP